MTPKGAMRATSSARVCGLPPVSGTPDALHEIERAHKIPPRCPAVHNPPPTGD